MFCNHLFNKWSVLFTGLLLVFIISCRPNQYVAYDSLRPEKPSAGYFDKHYLLYKLPDNYYNCTHLHSSFHATSGAFIQSFKPFGYNTALNLQYTHIYSPKCVYHTADTIWKYAEVCFPNTCLTHGKAYAQLALKNTYPETHTFYVRLFYQNTSYWYRTDDSLQRVTHPWLDNYYGASDEMKITLLAGTDSVVQIPFTIGLNPKGEFGWDDDKDPARPGNYEFMALALPDSDGLLMNRDLNLMQINPFAVVKMDELDNNGQKYYQYMSYTAPNHFRFVFLDEYFNGANDLTPNHIYIPKNGKEKPLCDTCSGWYKEVISEAWQPDDFFKGYIARAGYVKADYGIKPQNCSIVLNGIKLTIPKSTKGDYKKTWGEFLFGPSFKYGHLTVRAKFAPMTNKAGTPNGIIHNLWLYQRDPDPVDTNNPYSYLRNPLGKQPYEIDFEIWNSQDGVNSQWDDSAFINYSIVDYMRDTSVVIKPGGKMVYDGEDINRLNVRQLNVPGKALPPSFFNQFHTYELYWYPEYVRFLVDGKEDAVITKQMARIPNKYLFLWIGSPLYQDGVYYSQPEIPFLENDKNTVIDYIRID
ncbi:MAG TPA: family 16 glycosylhydrolase [Chitinophagales bacterium]|nr:family 16 glycosylhydrolase [Chitinophagales bacterium]